ncbi:hypothetical protein CVT26_001367 [Gymnopilus dilepis]|uniref:Aminoglycoside phosphotransferase domain-containing protein n=1 Tax=Gymnopilus dilepis TaxID=231916 RepID=A0A409YUM6_9AGAR|nr:hypothetical protein CVT26_001367 [Gymnopilus dilepis]
MPQDLVDEVTNLESEVEEAANEEPSYIHTVAPDPRRSDPIDNPVWSSIFLPRTMLYLTCVQRIAEEGCTAITEQKKYYEIDNVFVKRNLTPSEWAINIYGHLLIPYKCKERLKNEAAAIRYIKANTSIPVPNIRCAFEDHGRFYLMTDIVPGVQMANLPDDVKGQVIKEVDGYVAQMHAIKSKVMGGFAGDVILPYRLSQFLSPDDDAKFRDADTPEFVLCHNDLSQHNIIVDEETLKVNAILDWEYAGFFPPEFDGKFYLRPGPSVALEGELDDVEELFQVIDAWAI